MVMVLCYLMMLRAQASLVSTMNEAMCAYKDGKFDKAENIFHAAEGQFIGDESFQSDYFDFLTKIGKYQKILEFEGVCRPSNKHYIENARHYFEELRSNNLKRVSDLAEVSPNYLDVVLYAIEYSLETQNFSNFQKYMTKATQLDPKSPILLELKGRYQFFVGNHGAGCAYFREAGLVQAASEYEGILRTYQSIGDSGLPGVLRFPRYESLYSVVLKKTIKDVYHPTIYKNLYHRLLADLATVGCQFSIEGAYKYAERLTTIELTGDTVFLMIKASITDGRPSRSTRELISKHRGLLDAQRLRSLETLVAMVEKRESERKAAEEQQRYRRQQQQQQQQQQAHKATPKAGEDFLKYYEAIKGTSKMNPREIKKAYNKAIRAASRTKDPKMKDQKMKAVNKAYKILSNEQTKRMYDQGVDPENPHASQQGSQQHHYQSHDGEPDLNDILNNLFGGSGRGRSRSQYFYFG